MRVTDEFMEAVINDGDWWTKSRLANQPLKRYKARDLMHQIAEATHQCGDPGMQYDTTVNRWHTSKNTARINASNPCSEYMFLDDSACNLASLNLMKFVKADGVFDVEAYRHAVDTVIMAQEILVDNAAYPTEKIAKNSHDFRPLGLGYANLGALLMSMGLAYDSDHGRDWAAALTAIMCGQAYLTSARIAEGSTGPCDGYAVNEEPFLNVIRMHLDATSRIDSHRVPAAVYENARKCWEEAYELGKVAGYRNAQTTVLAPTGTIGFMMDCDTTGIEPDLALVKYKKLVGGGVIKIVNNTVPAALTKLGYNTAQINAIVDHIDSSGTIEGAPMLKPEHLSVFDCSFRPQNGVRSIHYMGHVRMMAAVQPFHLRRDFEDHQHAGRMHGRRRHGRLHRELEAGPEGGGHLSRQFQARAAAELRHGQGREGRQWPRAGRREGHRESGLPAGAPQAARRARVHHAQVLDRRPRRLPHRRPL